VAADVLLGRVQIGAGRALAVSAAVVLAGIIGARAWYVMLQRGKTEGLAVRGRCIQGTVAGGALAAVPALMIASIPVGTFFDAATPGLFFAMAAGRQGCFLTGCCGGRLTASRFGIWSSDGRIGVRRLPAQQLEALACLLIAATALAAFLETGRAAGGAVFAGGMAVYILARQGLLALRAEPRRWPLAGPVTLAAAAAALLADIAVAALR
jgi:phosphatidylglycerol:prolipoprotein diacylglycerol transferase